MVCTASFGARTHVGELRQSMPTCMRVPIKQVFNPLCEHRQLGIWFLSILVKDDLPASAMTAAQGENSDMLTYVRVSNFKHIK
jgi:hypothetical protein